METLTKLLLCSGFTWSLFLLDVPCISCSPQRHSRQSDALQNGFRQLKEFLGNNTKCVFPSRSDYEADILSDSEEFTLKPCSSEEELTDSEDADHSFGIDLCRLFFIVSRKLCSSVEEDLLKPETLAQLANKEGWDVCTDVSAELVMSYKLSTFSFMTENMTRCRSQCVENQKIAPICRLLIAAVLQYETERHWRSGTGTVAETRKPAPSKTTAPAPKETTTPETTPAPKETTPAPKETTTPETTPAPKETTPAPKETTTPNETVTPAPEKMTPAPKKTTTPAPTEAAQPTTKGTVTPAPKKTTKPTPEETMATATEGATPPPEKPMTPSPEEIPSPEETPASPAGETMTPAPEKKTTPAPGKKDGEKKADDKQAHPVNKTGQAGGASSEGGKLDTGMGETSSVQFLLYLLLALVLIFAAYVIYHNRQKIIGYITEKHGSVESGQSSPRSGGSSKKKVKYSPLKPSAEELLPEMDRSVTTRNYIY